MNKSLPRVCGLFDARGGAGGGVAALCLFTILKIGVLFVVVAVLGCTEGGRAGDAGQFPNSSGKQKEYSEIRAASSARARFGLCALVRHPMFGAAAGLYRVERLKGVTEEDLWNPGSHQGFTYVDLKLLEGWHDASEDVVARIPGGLWPSGASGGWDVTLKNGETVGLLLMHPVSENMDHHGLHSLGTFHLGPNGGYTNGQLFTSRRVDAMELGELVKGLAGVGLGADCPYDQAPDDGESVEDGGSE